MRGILRLNLAALSCAAALAACGGGAATSSPSPTPTPTPVPTPSPSPTPTPEPSCVELRLEATGLAAGTDAYKANVDAQLELGCLIYVSGPGDLYLVDTASAAATKIGLYGTDQEVYDIALAPDGTLYGVSRSSSVLVRVDRWTAKTTDVGNLGLFANGLAPAPDGKLYASGDKNLYLVDPETPKASLIMPVGDNFSSGDVAFDGDSVLYASGSLLRLDVAAETYEAIGTGSYVSVYGLKMTPAGLFGCTDGGELIAIDPTTGEYSVIGKPVALCWGVA